ncbi:restriction modification system DNA specificity domain-containing protein [Vibrio zhanjiangensis]|uniref:Restriction modification system DNA specificity domain-containing protein n=1 Tax=Vibrio zhanjiangensis TaxID=1046128 RepID=A0ABQ6F1W7_9VIBR|nr:restriction endonuclease subunit S [Vibrio zhanjiangensis]GLT19450.1 restriction modification system DNA specificity domain-containing protein [Vibrio zhanjiangensis]
MGKYQAYTEYTTSNAAWLDEYPSHWKLTQVKYGYQVVLGKMLQKSPKSSVDSIKPYLKAQNIQPKGMDISRVDSMWFSPEELHKLRLQKGDVLVSEGGDVGRSAIWNDELAECYIQNAINRVRPLGQNCSRYFNYWIGSLKSSDFINILCNKATIAHYTAEKLEASPLLLPSSVEQTQIANFLDHETAKIDTLIEKQQQLIKLLKEKRQAVISHAVTKGLNPQAPMKDSGVEWLGEVPEHWGISSLGYYASLNTGATPDRSNLSYWEGDIPWIKTGEVKYETIYNTEESISKFAINQTSVQLSPPGTLLMAMYGQGVTRGRVAILGVHATYNQACVAITPNSHLFNEYLKVFFIAGYHAIRDGGNETSQMNLNADIVRKFKVTAPPIDEQKDIVSFLESELPRFDVLLEKADKAIKLMQERRTALISAAVTGKIDVRHFTLKDGQAPISEYQAMEQTV